MEWELLSTEKFVGGTIDALRDILLVSRGITTEEQKKEFFNPTHPRYITLKALEIHETSAQKAVERLRNAHEKKERIIIYGDYDVDGVCSTSILWQCMFEAGFNVLPFIPNRFSDGYGMKPQSVTRLKETYPDLSLIITVDNGIVANEAVDVAGELGIDVIITDHHEPLDSVPKATSIVHTTKVCGSAVAWIFARELAGSFDISKRKLDSLLELVAMGTIADQMPLTGVNRSLAIWGLSALNKSETPGMQALLQSAALIPGSIGVYEVGFLIAPRINAAGRLADATDAVRLLCTRSSARANEIAALLGTLNTDRQDIVTKVMEKATQSVTPGKQEITIVVGDYHEGVIGLAASKLVENLNRPAIVISKGETVSKGSARSIPGVHITELIRSLSHLLIDVGGHEMAAGFSIANEQIESFNAGLKALSVALLTAEVLTKKLKIDLEIPFDVINWELVECLEKFQPTGMGNPNPLFLARGVSVLEKKLLGTTKQHLKLRVYKDGEDFDAIFFNGGTSFDKINETTPTDIVFSVEKNIWNGKASIQLKLRALHMET